MPNFQQLAGVFTEYQDQLTALWTTHQKVCQLAEAAEVYFKTELEGKVNNYLTKLFGVPTVSLLLFVPDHVYDSEYETLYEEVDEPNLLISTDVSYGMWMELYTLLKAMAGDAQVEAIIKDMFLSSNGKYVEDIERTRK